MPKLAPKYPKKAPKSKINQTYKLCMAKRRYVPIFSKIAQKIEKKPNFGAKIAPKLPKNCRQNTRKIPAGTRPITRSRRDGKGHYPNPSRPEVVIPDPARYPTFCYPLLAYQVVYNFFRWKMPLCVRSCKVTKIQIL